MPRIFSWYAGPRGGENRKRNHWEARRYYINLYCTRVWEPACSEYSADVRAHVAGKTGKGIIERRGGIFNNRKRNHSEERRDYQLVPHKSLRSCVRIIFRWYSGPRGRENPKRNQWEAKRDYQQPEKESLRGEEGLSTYTVQESESLRAQNIRLMFGPTWWANRKRNHGGVEGLSTYSAQESESLHAQNIRLMFGPTWWANRKRKHWEESRDYQLILCKSLRACMRIIFLWYSGPRDWENRKRNHWEERRYFINLYCTRVWEHVCA